MRILSILLLVSLFTFQIQAQNKETRNVGAFEAIQMSMSGRVYVTQGNRNEVIVEADRDDLEKVRTEVRNGRLVIGSRSNRSWFSWGSNFDGRVNVYVTVKELRSVTVSGSGDVIGQNTIETEDFEASISGSGDIELEIDAKRVESSISGSGNIELSGAAEDVRLGITGSGKFYAEEMRAGDYNIKISGSGRASITTFGELDVRISGSGGVYYSGQPTDVNTSISGSGRVRRNN